MCPTEMFNIYLLIAIFVCILFILYQRQSKSPCLGPRFPFGSTIRCLQYQGNFGKIAQDIYQEMKRKNWKLGEIYFGTSPTYFAIDLEHVKNVLKQDFLHFVDRGVYYNEKVDPIGTHLFSVGGYMWRNLRHKISPTFSSSKIKTMFHTLVECSTKLEQSLAKEISKKKPLEIKKILECFTVDVIGSCAFGLELKTFEQENSPFRMYGRRIFVINRWRYLRYIFLGGFPNVGRMLKMKTVSKEISDFFMKIVKDIMVHRESNNWSRKDFFQLLLDLKNNDDKDNSLTFEEIAAQCFVFFLAGYETSSMTITFALYELAKNQQIQDKLREEIISVLSRYDGKTTYESIQEMKYLGQVIDETLRKYPPAPVITRKCVKDYKVPNERVTIKKGTIIMISVSGIHYDEEFYSNPHEFDPDRFSVKNKGSRNGFSHIPFGEGPRICIGMRFGLLEVKVGLISLLKKYIFTVNEKTTEPLKYKTGFFLELEKEILLDATHYK